MLSGPLFPVKVYCCLRVVNTIIGPMAIGGQKDSVDGPKIPYIFNLVCSGSGMDIKSSCYWRKLDQSLHFSRGSHVVIPLGDSFAHKMCNTGMFQIAFHFLHTYNLIFFKDVLLDVLALLVTLMVQSLEVLEMNMVTNALANKM